ncbi:YcaO-like family protein [Desulfovibrio inopinatus]|uniref:YcaO-like family protein n=1 Tax=Desulfovibrio inopinatus TaxID=102109 RepID=UPI0004163ADC|nr:YcaO-like family protein [Desulfovibrio inopinatus]
MTQNVRPMANVYANHKDRLPAETVAKIQAILHELGIGAEHPMTEVWQNPVDDCHSVRVWDPSYPLVGANGKGISEVYCLASAYAEFIERLQCYSFRWFGALGQIYPRKPIHHDEVVCSVDDLMQDIPEILHDVVDDPGDLSVDSLMCLPFWDVNARQLRMLPYYLMLTGIKSTGMSAGNTPEEALCQGICEIMERYAAREVIQGAYIPPTIPLEELPLESHGLKHMLDMLHGKGFEVIVKDCTMGGTIPVLAAIVIDHAKDRFNLCFGSDPVFDVALQRCITELYQGRAELPHSFSYWQVQRPPLKDYYNRVYATLSILLNNAPSTNFQAAFTAPGQSNTAYFTFMCEKVHALGYPMYVRDFSFLGFPTYYVYIQGMSCPPSPSVKEANFYLDTINEAFEHIYRMAQGKNTDVHRLADIFSRTIRSESIFSSTLVISLSHHLHSRVPLASWVEPCSFLAFIFIEAGMLDNAIDVLQQLPGGETPDEVELCSLLLDYCRLASKGQSDAEILTFLQERYGEGEYGRSLRHLINGHYASLYCKAEDDAPGNTFSQLPLPQCDSPLSCQTCTMRSVCSLSRYLEIRKALHKAYIPIDQTKLGDIVPPNPSCMA